MVAWEKDLGCWQAFLGGGLILTVYRDDDPEDPDKPFEVVVFDVPLRDNFASLEEAQAAAEREARRMLNRALVLLGA